MNYGSEKRGASRPYRMEARLEAVEETRERILQAMIDLWLDRRYDELTIGDVANAAGVSRQTVYRHFGTKDEVLTAASRWAGARFEQTMEVEPGDIDAAVDRLVQGYEVMGDANARSLELEGRIAAIDEMLRRGREAHRSWLERTFGPFEHEDLAMALYAATDVMVWKLLRRDFGHSTERTARVMKTLVRAVLEAGAAGA